MQTDNVLARLHPVVAAWFGEVFETPTRAQTDAWPAILSDEHTLLLAPTGSGKTLAAFLVAIDRLMFPRPEADRGSDAGEGGEKGVRILYISPLKALGVDIERNLRAPLAGIRAVAAREGVDYDDVTVAVRSGDTTPQQRRAIARTPPDILITTPESLYLLLTSAARDILRSVEVVIVDEIHTMVASKRGTHLFVSLERLELLRRSGDPRRAAAQRVGLSATQRPLEEVARLLGGAEPGDDAEQPPQPRPVTIVDASAEKLFDFRVEVPVEDMAALGAATLDRTGEFEIVDQRTASIWPSIHPRLVELIRGHRSTMIFVNSRRLAERLAAAVNELAGEELALAHHGSIAKDLRLGIEERLKSGDLPAIIATSSLELGIDMGAVDLVVQIEAPPSVASGLQRIGRAGHQVGARSSGIIFPKFRGDLLACATAVECMLAGQVEKMAYPRNPLDVLAQQLTAMVALESVEVDRLYATVRCAAPYFELPRSAFEGTLDMLAGRYPSDDFAGLSARVHWDRVASRVEPLRGTQRTAVLNAGTIPDRGLYGVFLATGGETGRTSKRVGELDEEMVFESRVGEVFLLGASSWRIVEITHDRVEVVPAPGEPGRMPFWHGDRPGRPVDFGRAIGRLTRRLHDMGAKKARAQLVQNHGLDPLAAENLLRYIHEQAEATGDLPSDRTIVVERFLDEVGDWRVTVLSPFGARVHAPWALAVVARLRERCSGEVDMMWSDDGIVYRLPEADAAPGMDELFPAGDEIEQRVIDALGQTSLFASHFRENAGRALLLPRRQVGRRMPLWVQRRRAADLLSAASRYASFPVILETFRECLRDVFDLEGLASLLRDVESRAVRVREAETKRPSPFSATLLFNYVANFLYDGDAPLAERRAQTLALDHAQLRELLGDAEMRELLDPEAIEQIARELQRIPEGDRRGIRHADALAGLLRQLGDLERDEIELRCDPSARAEVDAWIEGLVVQRRIVEVGVGGQRRFIAVEDCSRYRDALGVVPPVGVPIAFLEEVDDPLGDLVARYARTHVPFLAEHLAQRFSVGLARVRSALTELAQRERVLEGEFLPRGRGREWCDAEVLRRIKRRSLARLRREVEPVDAAALGRFLPEWHGITRPRAGLEGVLEVVEQLQGLPIPASVLDREILPARVSDYRSGDLDELCSAGEVVWRGVGSLGSHDGRIALYLHDHYRKLAPPPVPADGELCGRLRELLGDRGALFFETIASELGGYAPELLGALWDLVWAGEVTNDTLAPMRSLHRAGSRRGPKSRPRGRSSFRSRRLATPGSEGRWSLLAPAAGSAISHTERLTALVQQLLERHGVLTREAVASEEIPGGFSAVYPVLRQMEETGRVRRGYFVAGLGATQFCRPGADDRLRGRGPGGEEAASKTMVMAATDPANPYGAALPWPDNSDGRWKRSVGARVILFEGGLIAGLGRSGDTLTTNLPEEEPTASAAREALLSTLCGLGRPTQPLVIRSIDGEDADGASPFERELISAGFSLTARGLVSRTRPS